MDKEVSFYKDFFKLQGNIEVMKKDQTNPFYGSAYVPLPKMLKVLKPVFQEHGFILTQSTSAVTSNGVGLNVVCSKLIHAETGLSESSAIVITPDLLPKADMQKLGGAITYGRRYTLSALLGLEESDDDGNVASGKTEKKESKSSSPKTASGTTKSSSAKSSKAKSSGFRNRTKAKPQASGGDDW